MNSQGMKFLLLVLFGPVLVGSAIAQTASDEQMSLDAVWSALGKVDAEVIERHFEEALSDMRTLAGDPLTEDQVLGVTVVFQQGKTPVEVEEFAGEYGFEVVDAQIKYPFGDQGQIVTMGIGTLNLLMMPGTLAERLTMAVGSQQLISSGFTRDASGRYSPGSSGTGQNVNALNPNFKVYQLKLLGSPGDLIRALDQNEFVVFIPDHTEQIVDNYTTLVERAAQMNVRSSGSFRVRLKPGQSFEDAILDSLPPGIPRDRVILNRPPIPPPLN